ncbi:hypothetical protein PLESTF_000823000 [Pleodorina starrii]|nr:hypothetical protein PLESTM_000174100 [Pleodorina starrii]GLC69375.1 hypothetical protein PLESTF_000823000 [Pleodorina starrii]
MLAGCLSGATASASSISLVHFARRFAPLARTPRHPAHFVEKSHTTTASASRPSVRSAPPARKQRGGPPHQKGRPPGNNNIKPRPPPPSPPPPSPHRRAIFPSPPMDAAATQAATLLVQNMMVLCRQLRLPVSYKVQEWREGAPDGASATDGGSGDSTAAAAAGTEAADGATLPRRHFSVVVHVHGDHAFKKYLQNFSSSDLLLYRGLLLLVETAPDMSRLMSARAQQAFLPKFENEGQDAAVADRVAEAAAAGRPTIITIKHSGSLVTLSYDGGWAAKNSVANEFTAGGAALLRAHFDRRHPTDPSAATASLDRLMSTLAARRLCLSFEMVTGSHGHHGQLPAAEYLVATAAHTFDPVTGAPTFLPWLPFLELCGELGLPTNDTWLVAGGGLAGGARQALDALALRGGPTGHALRQLDALVEEGAAGGEAGCLRLPGTYPHDEWQGQRLEGFVVAAGQELGPEEVQRLKAIRDSLAAGRLPLAAVPEHLRRPYQHALREALATTAASKGANGGAEGGGAAAAAAAPAPAPGAVTDAVRSRLQAAAAAWMPQAALSYASPGGNARERLTELLASQPPEGLAYGKPYMELPEGRGRIYSRLALEQLGMQGLKELLASELAAAEAAAAAVTAAGGGASSDRDRVPALREAAAEAASASNPPPAMLLVRALRALAGHPETSIALRYKKKMLMWSFPDTAAAAIGGADGGVIGYSLMTFVIRNGLPALRQGAATYAAYVDNLVRRSWGLPKQQVAQVQHFARCWAAWVAARGGAAAVDEGRYLEVAEPFAEEFLRRRGAMAMSGRSETAFQGVLICVDTSEAFTQALRRAVAPSLDLQPAKLGDTPFSKGMVPGGAMLWLQPGGEHPKRLREFLSGGAAAFTWVVAASAPRPTGPDNAPEAKRQKGLAQAKIGAVTAALGADGAASRVRHVTLPAPEDDVDGAASARLATEVAAWLGRGTPLPPADPAVAAYFVTIPGAGKSALVQGMRLPEGPGQQQQQELTVKVLNSDIMKKTVKNFNPNRYWLEVAAAADSCVGRGHCVVSVADKNLVPAPPGNIARALESLKGTGVASLALVPVVAGPSTLSSPAPSYGDLYGGLPDLPFPLELVALCMMRTLKRRNHEGGLDGEKAPSAATVVAMFAGFYRHKTLPDLLAALRNQFTRVVELPIMRGDGVGGGGEAAEDAAGGGAEASEASGGGSVPLEVLRHVAEGVREVSERSKPQLPAAWEARARELLLRPDVVAALEALQLPMEDVRRKLEEEVAATLEQVKAAAAAAGGGVDGDGAASVPLSSSLSSEVETLQLGGDASAAEAASEAAAAADGADGAAAAAEERVSYFSVAGLDAEALRAAARQCLVSELQAKLRRGPLHVTLWHRADPELGRRTDLRRALMGLVGSPVELEVTDIDISPEVVAANVRLLSADEAIPARPYHHITLLVEKGHLAVESNALPARLAAGEPGVERRPLPGGPLLLSGVVTAVEADEPSQQQQPARGQARSGPPPVL